MDRLCSASFTLKVEKHCVLGPSQLVLGEGGRGGEGGEGVGDSQERITLSWDSLIVFWLQLNHCILNGSMAGTADFHLGLIYRRNF